MDVALRDENVSFSNWDWSLLTRPPGGRNSSSRSGRLGQTAVHRVTDILSLLPMLVLSMGLRGLMGSMGVIGVMGALAIVGESHRAEAATPLHATGDQEKWDRKKQEVELFGHATVSQPGETITADYIFLDQKTRILDAKGNCVYTTGDSVVYGDEMHLNLDTRTGTILNGRITNEGFSLTGQRINKLGERRYQARWGEYTTCRDCPSAWSLLAESLDMEMEGYAFLFNVYGKLKSAPALWAPALVFPLKTKRQTGFLAPTYSLGSADRIGWVFGAPFFWAIDRNMGLLLRPELLTARGFRWGSEFKWIPFPDGQTSLQVNFNGLWDSKLLSEERLGDGSRLRWGLVATGTSPLPWRFWQSLALNEMSDSLVPNPPLQGSGGFQEAFSTSRWDLKRHFDFGGSLGVAIQKTGNRTIVSRDRSFSLFRFDRKTVQTLPKVDFNFNERSLFGLPVYAGFRSGVQYFYRPDVFYDFDPSRVFPGDTPAPSLTYEPGIDPIRKGVRLHLVPSIYTGFSLGGLVSVTPSVEGNQSLYVFPGSEYTKSSGEAASVAPLLRSYFKFKLNLSTQFERIFDTPWKDNPRIKHLVRPFVGYSYIPTQGFLYHVDSGHPFNRQVARSQYYAFDSMDLIPLKASGTSDAYLLPEGSAVTYGLSTRLIRRVGALDAPSPSYDPFLEFWLFQVADLLEFQKPEPRPFSRLIADLSMRLGKEFTFNVKNLYYPYLVAYRNQFDMSFSYLIESSTRQGVMAFSRGFNASYSYNRIGCSEGDIDCGTSRISLGGEFSLNDHFLPSASIEYDLKRLKLQTFRGGLVFQSASRCWRVKFEVTVDVLNGSGVTWSPNIELNLSGSGFGNVQKTALDALGGRIQ